MSDAWAVLVHAWGGYDLVEAGAAVARALGQPRADIAPRLRRSPGLPFEDLTEADARAVLEVLRAQGLEVSLLVSQELPAPPRPRWPRGGRFTEAGLELQLGDGVRSLPWDGDDLVLLAGAVRLEGAPGALDDDPSPDAIDLVAAVTRRATTGDLDAAARAAVADYLAAGDAGVPGQRLVLHLDLVGAGVELLRIQSDHFEYRCLGERAGASTLVNLQRVAATLQERFAPSVPRADGFQALARGALAGAAVDDLDTYHRRLRWHLTMQAREPTRD